jgi:N-acylneuraminate cytidylyltransferase
VAGKPLIVHTIAHAVTAEKVDRVIVSTDDKEIASVSREYGAEVVLRPSDISDDFASSESALMHVLSHLRQREGYEAELIVFLQCTSPIRRERDIDQAILKLQAEAADSLLSVSPSHRFIWTEVDGKAKSLNYDYRKRPRRQDLQPQYAENGSIYIFKPWVLETLGNRLGGKLAMYVMDEDSAWDIDTPFDLEVVERLMLGKKGSHE